MKTILFLAVVTCAMACVLVSCGGGSDSAEPEPPKPDSPSITIASGGDATPVINVEGGTADVSFTATAAWTASVQNGSAWLSVSPQSGRAGDGTVHITAKANETYDERNAAVLLTCGTASKTVTVTQKQKDALTLTSGKVELEAEGGTFSIRLKTNVSVTCEVEAAAQEWLKTATGTRALTDKTLDFEALPNDGKELRQAVITLKGGSLQESVTVYQAGSKPTLVLTEKEYIVGSEGAGIKVELKSNTSYEVQLPEVDWIKETATRAISSYTHHFTVSPNGTYDSRTAEILFINREEGIEEKVTVTQLQEDAIIVAKNEYEVPAAGGALDFALQANVDFTVETSVDWIQKVTATRGLTGTSLHFQIVENTTEKLRQGIISILSGILKQEIQVIQKAKEQTPVIVVEQSKYTVQSEGETMAVELQANVDYEIRISADWITEVQSRSLSSHTHHFVVASNEGYDARTAEIIFVNEENKLEKKVSVTQMQKDAIIVAKNEYNVEAAGGMLSFEVNSNVEYIVETSVDWIRQTDTRKMNSDYLNFEIAANENAIEREGVITIQSLDGKIVQHVVVKQSFKPYYIKLLSAPMEELDAERQKIVIKVETNASWLDVNCTENWMWLYNTVQEQKNIIAYIFQIDQNKGAQRASYIVLDNGQLGVEKQQIKISQKGSTDVDLGIDDLPTEEW